MIFKLDKKEAQAVISATNNMLQELKTLQDKNIISFGWSLMFNDLIKGNRNLEKQYFKQLKD